MITLDRISKTFQGDIQAVREVSFTVQNGELLGLIGTSGSGKTTTLKMINRLIEPSSGTISIDGKNIMDRNPETLRRSIGYVIQHIGLFPHYTIRQNLETVPKLLDWDTSRIQQRCNELMELTGMGAEPAVMEKMPNELSGGQQQRIGLARALAADPPIVLLDEPFGALDPITRANIRSQFKDLQQQLKKTMVMVTHDIAEAFELCDRIALLDGGQLQQLGTARELLFQPVNSFTKSFFNPNRFLLEMLTITIGQSARYAQPTSKKERVLTFRPETPFLNAFKQLENRADENVCITLSSPVEPGSAHWQSHEDKQYFTGDQLLNGFYKAKQKFMEKADD